MAKKGWTSRIGDFMAEYAYWVTIGAVIAVMAGSAIYTRELRQKQETGIQAAAEAAEIAETPAPTAEVTPMPTIAPLSVNAAPIRAGVGTVWPVNGKIIRVYDAQQPVFWEALGCWQVHEGLDIAGEKEEPVRCAMDGIVGRTAYDALWGWTVLVEQTDGSTARYAGLLTAAVTQGQSVTRGQTLGVLMDTIPCEAELGTHLHMELKRNGVYQDPESMMPER